MKKMNNEQDILKEIAAVDEQIQSLNDKRKVLVSDLQRCKTENSPPVNAFLEANPANVSPNNLSVHDKIVLFRNLFRGREDVFAFR